MARKNAARPGFVASTHDSRPSEISAPIVTSTHIGTARRSMRPVTNATAITITSTKSTGAGSITCTPSSRNASETAHL